MALIQCIFLIWVLERNQLHAKHQQNLSIFILKECILFFLRDNNQQSFFHMELFVFQCAQAVHNFQNKKKGQVAKKQTLDNGALNYKECVEGTLAVRAFLLI